MTTAITTLDLPRLRARFPALGRMHRGHPVAYFDGPGGTQVPAEVVEAMSDYLLYHNANTHWAYPSSIETDVVIASARAALGDYLGAPAEAIVFGANMTTLTFHLARALGRGWKAGDEVVITELDHHANVAPWQALERERGIVLRQLPLDLERGELDLRVLERMLNPRTRLVAIGAGSNALGTVTDVTAAARLAHDAGALCFVDAVHLAAHGPVDAAAIGCDFLACSAYKFYGPHLGVLVARPAIAAALDVPKLEPAPDAAPERMETGTLNHEGIAGARAAVEFIASLGEGADRRARLADAGRRLHAAGHALVTRLWDGLGSMPGVRRYGPPPTRPRTATISFTVAGHPAEAVTRRLVERGVFTSHGDFYAATVVRRYGLEAEGLVRAGCACYNSPEEVERLLAGVAQLAD